MIRTAIFDLGGVFIHIDIRPSIKKMSEIISNYSEVEIADFLQNSEPVGQYQRGEISSCDFYSEVQYHFKTCFSYDLFKDIWQNIFSPNLQMIQFLNRLKKNLQLVLLSNTNELHIDHLMKQYPFFHSFHLCIFSHRVGMLKPDSSIYEYTLFQTKARAEQCIFVDDSLSNIETAYRLGMHGIHFSVFEDFLIKWNSVMEKNNKSGDSDYSLND